MKDFKDLKAKGSFKDLAKKSKEGKNEDVDLENIAEKITNQYKEYKASK